MTEAPGKRPKGEAVYVGPISLTNPWTAPALFVGLTQWTGARRCRFAGPTLRPLERSDYQFIEVNPSITIEHYARGHPPGIEHAVDVSRGPAALSDAFARE